MRDCRTRHRRARNDNSGAIYRAKEKAKNGKIYYRSFL